MIKKKYIIKGEVWRVVWKKSVRLEYEPCYGLCDYMKRIIYLEKGMSRRQERQVFLHEFIHAVMFELHLELGTIVDEAIAEGLSQAILSHFKLERRALSRRDP
jgi:Zn-dependent peptidase ImmA (M78 family)